MQNKQYPGKPLTYYEAKNTVRDGEVAYVSGMDNNGKNYRGEKQVVVYIAETNTYYLMTKAEYNTKVVQDQVDKERRAYFGELVSQERVGS